MFSCQQITLEIEVPTYKFESTIFYLEVCLLGEKKVEEVWQGVHHLVAVAEEAGGLPQPARGQAHLLLSTKLLQAPPHQGHLLLGAAGGDQVVDGGVPAGQPLVGGREEGLAQLVPDHGQLHLPPLWQALVHSPVLFFEAISQIDAFDISHICQRIKETRKKPVMTKA